MLRPRKPKSQPKEALFASQAIEDVKIYTSMSEDDLNKLPNFETDGSVKFYTIGDSIFGKLSLIQFIKSIKTKYHEHLSN